MSIAGAVLAEWLFAPRATRGASLKDSTGILTGLLLALTLPSGLPLWMAFLGGFVSIAFGKVIWGGLGHNLFNPALVGRAFLLATFPATWLLMLFLGNVGLGLSYWGTLPLGILVSVLISGATAPAVVIRD